MDILKSRAMLVSSAEAYLDGWTENCETQRKLWATTTSRSISRKLRKSADKLVELDAEHDSLSFSQFTEQEQTLRDNRMGANKQFSAWQGLDHKMIYPVSEARATHELLRHVPFLVVLVIL